MLDVISSHPDVLFWAGLFSIIAFAGSLLLIPWLCVRLRSDHFLPHPSPAAVRPPRHPMIRVSLLVVKNVAGMILLAAGIAMLVLPGQGILTILIGLMLLSFPGKRAIELRLLRLPGVLPAINAIRARSKMPPLQLPP